MDYERLEKEMIEDFTEYECLMRQLKRYKDDVEYNITPLVKLYSVFLEDGKSLEELFNELQVELNDVEDIIGGI